MIKYLTYFHEHIAQKKEVGKVNEEAGIQLCFSKGYHLTTFYKCMRNEGKINPKWRNPNHSFKWNDQEINQTCKIISQRPVLTLQEIINFMVSDFKAPEISESTLSSYLEFSLITLKNIAYHATARNSIQTKSQRVSYCEFFIENSDSNFIYIDEVGSSLGKMIRKIFFNNNNNKNKKVSAISKILLIF